MNENISRSTNMSMITIMNTNMSIHMSVSINISSNMQLWALWNTSMSVNVSIEPTYVYVYTYI